MKRIVLDTNFLVSCINAKIDFFLELTRICDFTFQIYVLDKTLDELEKIAESNSKDGLAAKTSLALLKDRAEIIKSEDNVDDSLISMADENTIIATLDKELQKRISYQKIIIKQRKFLAFK